MLAHSALARLAAAKTSARNLPQLARFHHRTLLAHNASDLPATRALTRALNSAIEARRCYATTKSATAPTATVKKAVKAQAVKKPAPRKTAATKTKAAAKKPAAGKSKPKTRAKAKPKKKAAPKKKAVVKKRVKKVLTPEEQQKAKIAELRKKALKEPLGHGVVSAYNVFIAEQHKGKGALDLNGQKDIVAKYKQLTPAQREHYNHLAAEQTAARRAEYKAWILSHTPAQIRVANRARAALRRLKAPSRSTRLVDDRQVKQPGNAYVYFFAERRSTSDFNGIPIGESSKLIGAEWKALNAGEKKKYQDQAAAKKAEYQRQMAAAA